MVKLMSWPRCLQCRRSAEFIVCMEGDDWDRQYHTLCAPCVAAFEVATEDDYRL